MSEVVMQLYSSSDEDAKHKLETEGMGAQGRCGLVVELSGLLFLLLFILPHFTYTDCVWSTCKIRLSVKIWEPVYTVGICHMPKSFHVWNSLWQTCEWAARLSHNKTEKDTALKLKITFHYTSDSSASFHLTTLIMHGHHASTNDLYVEYLVSVVTEAGKSSFAISHAVCEAQLWDLLPPELKQLKPINLITKLLQTHQSSCIYYSNWETSPTGSILIYYLTL